MELVGKLAFEGTSLEEAKAKLAAAITLNETEPKGLFEKEVSVWRRRLAFFEAKAKRQGL